MKFKGLIIFILIIAAFGAGVYFKNDAIRFYDNLNAGINSFQKTDIGKLVAEVQKELLTPPPLNAGGAESNVVLLKSRIIAETNLQRLQNANLPALKENAKLSQAAMAKANDMFKNQYFEHTSPSGVDPGRLVQNYGYDYILAGENLILGNFSSEKEVVQDWMNSPGHRANILNNRYTEIGVSIIKGTYKGETVWIGVQEFGLPVSSCPAPDNALKNKIDADKILLDQLSLDIDQKKAEIENTNRRSAQYNILVDEYNQLVGQYNPLANETKSLISQYNQEINDFNNCVSVK